MNTGRTCLFSVELIINDWENHNMEGKVLHFDEVGRKGIISDSSGNRYNFEAMDWQSEIKPVQGTVVDFVAEDREAKQIFAIKPANAANDIMQKMAGFQSSSLGQQISALFSNGLHNQFGFITSIVMILSLFLPFLKISLLGEYHLINGGSGQFLLVLSAILAIFFYGGATRLYTKILAGVVLGILLTQYYDLFSVLIQANNLTQGVFGSLGVQSSSVNFFQLVGWGALVNAGACAALFFAAFMTPAYARNDRAL
jgi:hypothetical protein